jgi:hypothetical protein
VQAVMMTIVYIPDTCAVLMAISGDVMTDPVIIGDGIISSACLRF